MIKNKKLLLISFVLVVLPLAGYAQSSGGQSTPIMSDPGTGPSSLPAAPGASSSTLVVSSPTASTVPAEAPAESDEDANPDADAGEEYDYMGGSAFDAKGRSPEEFDSEQLSEIMAEAQEPGEDDPDLDIIHSDDDDDDDDDD